MKRFALFLDRLNHSHQPPEAQSPFRASAVAALVSFVFIYWLDSRFISGLRLWWAELLLYGLVPTMLAFIILYRSAWHQEMMAAARTPLLALLSFVIFGAVLIGTGLAMALLAIVYYSSMDNFGTGHF